MLGFGRLHSTGLRCSRAISSCMHGRPTSPEAKEERDQLPPISNVPQDRRAEEVKQVKGDHITEQWISARVRAGSTSNGKCCWRERSASMTPHSSARMSGFVAAWTIFLCGGSIAGPEDTSNMLNLRDYRSEYMVW